MSTPTPGPWRALRPNALGTVHILGPGTPPQLVAYVPQSDREHTAEANGALIAAAPEMYEALDYILNWSKDGWDGERARDLARAAIAKATRKTTEATP